jgi:hypothetical protein
VPVVSAGTFADFIPGLLFNVLPYGAFATAIGAVLHVRLAHLVQNRRITFQRYQTWMWGLGGLSLLTGTFGLPVLITYLTSREAMHHWLPTDIQKHAEPVQTMPVAVANAARRRALRDGGVAFLLVVLLLTDSALLALNTPEFMDSLEGGEGYGDVVDEEINVFYDEATGLYVDEDGFFYEEGEDGFLYPVDEPE